MAIFYLRCTLVAALAVTCLSAVRAQVMANPDEPVGPSASGSAAGTGTRPAGAESLGASSPGAPLPGAPLPAPSAVVAGAQASPKAAASPPAGARASADLPEIGRIVTSDRRPEPIGDTSRPTFVVSRARIDAYGARTVSDALQGVPGVALFAYGPFGALVDYGIRGATSAQTLVLVDGMPVADPTTGTVYLGQLSTVGVERIEIVESGSSTLYGTSAAGGVINVVTRVPRGAYLAASAGSFADRDLRVALGDGRVGGSFERHVATNAYGYPALSYSAVPCANGFTKEPCAFAAGTRDNDFADQSALRLAADVPAGGSVRVRARADDTVTQSGAPGRLDFAAPNATQNYAMKTGLLELERRASASTFTLSAGGSQTRLAYTDLANNNGESDVYTGRAQLSVKDAIVGTHGDVVAGLDVSRESGTFGFPSAPDYTQPGSPLVPAHSIGASRSLIAAYAQAGTSPLPGTRLTAGLRAERDAPFGSVLAPSFGGVVRSGTVRFAGNIGESFRVPTLQDSYYPNYSNPRLVSERSSNADFTVAVDGGKATYSLGYFGRSGSNFIVLDNAFIPVNARRAQTAGIALSVTSRPFAGLIAEANFTDLYRALDLTTGARLPRNPAGQASLSLSRPFGDGRFAFGGRWNIVGSDGDDAANTVGQPSGRYDAYDSLDAYVRFKVAGDAVLTLRGFNLTGEQGAAIFGYPSPGRRLYAEISTHS